MAIKSPFFKFSTVGNFARFLFSVILNFFFGSVKFSMKNPNTIIKNEMATILVFFYSCLYLQIRI
ncbi:hypothetical protein HMPREF1122_02055 [Clostridioides difficile 002-P50-2011]|nr:hypothetical protein HMPREF1122_02055 [Clostridioides difficile 002-P50-2011]